MNERFRREIERYNLKSNCEHCAHFGGKSERCSMLYPVTPHREDTFLKAKDDERVYFCKMFEVDDA